MNNIFKDSISFVETLSLAAVKRNLEDIETDLSLISVSRQGVDFGRLVTAYAALVQYPSASTTVPHFGVIWSQLDQISSHHAFNSLHARLDRECIMLTNYFAWRWLDAYCPEQVLESWRNKKAGRTTASWIGKLALDVAAVLGSRALQHRFEASHYGLEIGAVSYTYSNKRGQLYVDDAELLRGILGVTTRIIASWLQFPVAGTSRYQAWFVYAILRNFGRGALLLDEVWRAYSQIRLYVLGRSLARVHCNERFGQLTTELMQHPLANNTSPESEALARVSQMLASIRNPSLLASPAPLMDSIDRTSLTSPPSSSVIAPSPLLSITPTLTQTSLPLPQQYPEGGPSPPYIQSPQASLNIAALFPDLSRAVIKKLEVFTHFIDESLVALTSPNLPRPSPWQTAMLADVDRFCPFRERAPSRLRAAGPMGPYGPDSAATPGGFLSALIFRGITFNTDFFRACRILYTDEADFAGVMDLATKQYQQEHGREPPASYFCDPCAYGPHNVGRTVELAKLYGTTVQTENIATQLELFQKNGKDTIPFVKFWNWQRGERPPRFPQLGPLGSYLVAADYTYTSPRLVEPPTAEEMGHLICTLNKGAVSALETLGLIPLRRRNKKGKALKSTAAACTKGLQIIHCLLSAHLSAAVRSEISFDYIMIEHSLCKFSRALARKKISV